MKIRRTLGDLAELAGGHVRSVPGIAAALCAFAGAWIQWGLGVALLVAVPFLLAADRTL